MKGREWDRVVVFGVTDGIVPHRLSEDIEEERRILHVGITRGRQRVLVLGDRTRRSRFLGELDGSAPAHRGATPAAKVAPVVPRPAARRRRAPRSRPRSASHVRVLGGYEGTISAVDDGGVRLALDDGGSFFVRFGERVTHEGMALTLGRPPSPVAGEAERRACGPGGSSAAGPTRCRPSSSSATSTSTASPSATPPRWPSSGPARASAPPSSSPTATRSSRSSASIAG